MANGQGYYGSICIEDLFTGKIVKNTAGKSFISIDDLKAAPFTVSEKNGKHYAGIGVWVNETADDFGNMASITLAQTEAQRTAKEKRTYISNLKKSGFGGPAATNTPAPAAAAQPAMDDLPF